MDRNIVYPGSIPLDTDLLATNRNAMVALGALLRAVLGDSTTVDELFVMPTVPGSLAVQVTPGSLSEPAPLEASSYGSLPADSTELVKMAINLAPTVLPLTAPATPGHSVTWLVEAAFQEADTDPVVLPYYNAANPAQPYLGPGNAGTAQATRRVQRVQLQLKPGVPAPSGTQVAPAVDAGWVALATVTVAHGQTAVGPGHIAQLPDVPRIAFRLPELRPGFATMQSFAASGTFVVPAGVTQVRVRAIGGGGGGGGNTGSGGGGGGGGGGYAEGVFAVSPGQAIAVTVGVGGAGGSNASGSSGGNSGGHGVASSFGAMLSAAGGLGGQGSLAGGQGDSGQGGSGAGGALNMTGGAGNAGSNAGGSGFGGAGGGGAGGGGGGAASSGLPSAGAVPGGGGAGGGGNYAGAAGARGVVIVEF
jgi:hypothetical protein